jgi:hypothetical protein
VADDLDIDDHPDVVVALSQMQNDPTAGDAVAIVHSTGAGGLEPTATRLPTGPGAVDIATGDLNGDRFPEILTAGSTGPGTPGSVSVLRNTTEVGDATSSFAAAQQFSSNGPDAGSVALGDFDGDLKLDLVVGNLGDGSVSVRRNMTLDRSTTIVFAPPQKVLSGPADRHPTDLRLADVDRDGRADIVVVNHARHSVSVLRNTTVGGSVSFAETTYPGDPDGDPDGRYPLGVEVADFDYDGLEDVVLSNFVSDNISLLRGTGGGALGAAIHQATDLAPRGLESGYLTPDARPDLVVAQFGRYPGDEGERAGSIAVLLAR